MPSFFNNNNRSFVKLQRGTRNKKKGWTKFGGKGGQEKKKGQLRK